LVAFRLKLDKKRWGTLKNFQRFFYKKIPKKRKIKIKKVEKVCKIACNRLSFVVK
jgi:hypothetical protein